MEARVTQRPPSLVTQFLGMTLGAFMHGDVEEDLPDIHARSVKSRDERKAGFVGGGTLE